MVHHSPPPDSPFVGNVWPREAQVNGNLEHKPDLLKSVLLHPVPPDQIRMPYDKFRKHFTGSCRERKITMNSKKWIFKTRRRNRLRPFHLHPHSAPVFHHVTRLIVIATNHRLVTMLWLLMLRCRVRHKYLKQRIIHCLQWMEMLCFPLDLTMNWGKVQTLTFQVIMQ